MPLDGISEDPIRRLDGGHVMRSSRDDSVLSVENRPGLFNPEPTATAPRCDSIAVGSGLNNQQLRRWFTIAVLLCLALPALSATAASSDARFLEGLRQRRLFALAESYCIERLNNSKVDDRALTVSEARPRESSFGGGGKPNDRSGNRGSFSRNSSSRDGGRRRY